MTRGAIYAWFLIGDGSKVSGAEFTDNRIGTAGFVGSEECRLSRDQSRFDTLPTKGQSALDGNECNTKPCPF